MSIDYRPLGTNEPPPGPVALPGFQFQTRLGPRRNIYPGDYGYFHKDRRRYYCRVLNRSIDYNRRRSARERFYGRTGYTLLIEIIELA